MYARALGRMSACSCVRCTVYDIFEGVGYANRPCHSVGSDLFSALRVYTVEGPCITEETIPFVVAALNSLWDTCRMLDLESIKMTGRRVAYPTKIVIYNLAKSDVVRSLDVFISAMQGTHADTCTFDVDVS